MTGLRVPARPLRVRTRSAFPTFPLAPGTTGALPGTPGLRFRTIADMPAPSRHERKNTANAVRVNALPGFKSPILRR
jgi:hypothetical protein